MTLATVLAKKCGTSKMLDFLDISIRDRDPDLPRSFHVTSQPIGETIKGQCSDHRRSVVCVDRLGSALECTRLWNLSLGMLSLCELVSC
ncbi:hypothetical protein AVEN_191131-1 [Araneus ventricosus]|uniref:Uncharacterized protein n=1 Tax=Araneus ventricosus TaxID=182803 RepID=A0A4Y2AZQ1_ARAVE|nr:hypothetical protein AVEN_191131-1 [Araneus ventricosus]